MEEIIKGLITIAPRIILGLVLLWIIVFAVAKKFQAKRAKEVLDKSKGKDVLGVSSSANFFGQESLGVTQLRGNGVLVLTNEELYFEMWLPKREFHIPISSIVDIETPKSHLGKTKFRPLLKVVFKNEKGEIDSVAWLLRNVPHWKEGLKKLSQGRSIKG